MTDTNNTLINKFREKSILVVGDLVADQFLHGMISRVSREAPVFILQHENTETIGGGAANAAANISSLGGTATLIGLIGKDSNGAELKTALTEKSVDISDVVESEAHRTTTKLRVLAGQQYAIRQQVIRIDYENSVEIDAAIISEIEARAIRKLDDSDAVVISDYGYGVADAGFVRKLIKAAGQKDIPVLVDSRSRIAAFSGATAATPNQEEVEQLLQSEYGPAKCDSLREELDLDALLVTLGNKGMYLSTREGITKSISIIGEAKPVDVTGAGDTVIAAFALGVASGLSFQVAAGVANHAGGIVVMKSGTATVTPHELAESIASFEPALAEESLHQAK